MNVLVTGASRGLGFGIVKYLLECTEETVIATCRNPVSASGLSALVLKFNVEKERLIVLPLDVTSIADHKSLVSSLGSKGIKSIDILILNAGIANSTHPHDDFMTCSVEDMTNVYNTNVVGTLLSLQSYHHLVNSSLAKVVVVMSSNLGSVTNNFGGFTSYRASKCALNMLASTYSMDPMHDQQQPGGTRVRVVCMHPGWVQTDMGNADGRTADITVEESVGGMMNIVYWTALCNTSEVETVDGLTDSHSSLMSTHRNHYTMASQEYKSLILSSDCSFVSYEGSHLGW